jgi:hypothetical protein
MVDLQKMAKHGIRNVLMQKDHGLAYAEVLEYTRQVAEAVKREDAKQLRKANTLAPDRAGRNLLWQASKLEQQADFLKREICGEEKKS